MALVAGNLVKATSETDIDNHPPDTAIADLAGGASLADVITKVNAILAALRTQKVVAAS